MPSRKAKMPAVESSTVRNGADQLSHRIQAASGAEHISTFQRRLRRALLLACKPEINIVLKWERAGVVLSRRDLVEAHPSGEPAAKVSAA